MKIVMTGGGSAGHVTPNMALYQELKSKGHEVSYIGTVSGIEHRLVTNEGLAYYAISAGKLRRYSSPDNFTDIFRTGKGFLQAFALLKSIKPDVVFSKGGFVACPVVWAAWMSRIPVVIHESNSTPGLANRLCMPFAKLVCYAFPETKEHIQAKKAVLTGIPIRTSLLTGNSSLGMKLCSFNNYKPVLLVMSGSLGAHAINTAIRSALPALLPRFQVCHICGAGQTDAAYDSLEGYRQFTYINEELPHLYSCASVVVARAGATTLFELLALKKPHLLIPLPGAVSRGDQIINARYFESEGYSVVLPEEKLNVEQLVSDLNSLLLNKEKYITAMSNSSLLSSTKKIIDAIEEAGRVS